MKRDVIISIKGVQADRGERDNIELITEGTLYRKKDKYYISYVESEVTGLSGRTTLKVEDQKVTMVRTGKTGTQMVFEQGKRYLSHYDTGFGIFNIGVNTQSIKNNIGDCGGSLKVRYTIDINNELATSSSFHISVKEALPVNAEHNTVS